LPRPRRPNGWNFSADTTLDVRSAVLDVDDGLDRHERVSRLFACANDTNHPQSRPVQAALRWVRDAGERWRKGDKTQARFNCDGLHPGAARALLILIDHVRNANPRQHVRECSCGRFFLTMKAPGKKRAPAIRRECDGCQSKQVARRQARHRSRVNKENLAAEQWAREDLRRARTK
jgi:hypothetical protein